MKIYQWTKCLLILELRSMRVGTDPEERRSGLMILCGRKEKEMIMFKKKIGEIGGDFDLEFGSRIFRKRGKYLYEVTGVCGGPMMAVQQKAVKGKMLAALLDTEFDTLIRARINPAERTKIIVRAEYPCEKKRKERRK
jgi:hypothetical protein